ncbi:long-chain fatty acid transport protein [Halomonas campaniensis]|uniref:Long-chain fatty acid transport protein n=1 Tax=Halomonas campaniensis TaxID=213554 RepID=A0A7W5PC62_9GAMM|nr:outer membrane protein transport protein [Halomonas campaniensis]MBB3332584.1 long-chain fatty acid transport protein [Halomonas campaniensis]
MTSRKVLPLLLLAGLAPAQALATNGYFSHGYGTINQGMAGAGTALAQDSIAAATNPAGMAFVGDRFDIGAELFSPHREYAVQGGGEPQPGALYLMPGSRKSENRAFLIPHAGYNRQVTETQTLGVSVFANGGMNTEYSGRDMGTFFAGKAGVNLEQAFIAPTWTWRFAERHAIGISPVIAYQRFSATGLSSLAGFSSDPAALSDNGTDDAWGYGLQLGWQGQLTDTLRGGLSLRKVLKMEEFDDYRGIFAEQGDFDIPQMFHAGLAWSGIEDHWLLLDVQHIRYSEIASVGNPFASPGRLGDDDGAGFGWDDMTVVKLGWQWQQTTQQAWRAGVSYGEQPIPDSEVLFNILAPGVQQWHVTGGFTASSPAG